MSTPSSKAELVLAQAKRAKTPGECSAVGRSVAQVAPSASHEEMDMLDEAMRIARDTFEAYRTGRVVSIRRPRTARP